MLYPNHTQVPRRGGWLTPTVGRAYLRLFGWRFAGEPPNLAKVVIAVAPHTSNWDFPLGMAVMFALDLKINFFGKHTLFKGLFGGWLRAIGGIPVNRTAAHGLVGEAVDAFAARDQLWLAIAPEGTRSKVERFKSGFLHIATGAKVPVLLIALDYGKREIRFGPLVETTGDIAADLKVVEDWFRPIKGRNAR